VIAFALIALFILVLMQVLFLFRIADAVRRRLRAFIPERRGLTRELVAGLLFLVMVLLVFGAYLFGPAYLVMLAFASALSIRSAELGKFLPVFLLLSLGALGVGVKFWPRYFAFSGLTNASTGRRR
jgi:hypothetical protein